MKYPTLNEVESADRAQICRWLRFLLSPGMSTMGSPQALFEVTTRAEARVMERIMVRSKDLGGMTPAISKEIVW